MSVVVAGALLVWPGGGGTLAQSAVPADACNDIIAPLPPVIDGVELQGSGTLGTDLADVPDIVGLITAAGVAPADFCMGIFSYGDAAANLGGLVRFRGIDATPMLEPVMRLASPCLAEGSCGAVPTTLAGLAVTQVASSFVVGDYAVVGDTIAFGTDGPVFAEVLAALVAGGAPAGSPAPGATVGPPPSAAPGSSAVPAP